MSRICVVTRNEIISGDVNIGNKIGNIIDEPFRTYGYGPEEFKKISLGKKFQSFLMDGEIIRYDRYSGHIRATRNTPLNIPFGSIVFIYGVGEDLYVTNKTKQVQYQMAKGLDELIFKFRLKCSLGRFEIEGDCELGPANYLTNPTTGKKEIISFKDGFMTLKNPKILSANKKIKYSSITDAFCSKYFEIAGIRFDVFEQNDHNNNPEKIIPAKINDSYFGLNSITPIIISTKERLLGPYIYREL